MPPLNNKLRKSKCTHHRMREAVAKCPECGLHYCRECITEYDGRMICASCLEKTTGSQKHRMRFVEAFALILLTLISFYFSWSYFVETGKSMTDKPDTFHDSGLEE